jgi:hypothetical protein
MKLKWLLGLSLSLWVQPAKAQTACEGGTCVAKDDLKVFLQLAMAQKCRAETAPTFKLDPITITVDRDGRVYGSGSTPFPYKVNVSWCNYQLEGTGQTSIVSAKRVEPTWGWRFRVKAAPGYLPMTAYSAGDAKLGLDFGLLVEPFFVQWGNVSAYVGIRSVGGGIGFDLLQNFGIHLGYATTWGTWQHNLHGALSFALW